VPRTVVHGTIFKILWASASLWRAVSAPPIFSSATES
jgi:hypothetical protein